MVVQLLLPHPHFSSFGMWFPPPLVAWSMSFRSSLADIFPPLIPLPYSHASTHSPYNSDGLVMERTPKPFHLV